MSATTPNAAEPLGLLADLRGQAQTIADRGIFGWGNTMTSAADLIEQQAARIAELEAALAQQVPEPQPESVNAQMLEALRDTTEFIELYSNRWDGFKGKHPFGVYERAKAAIAAAEAAQAGSAQQVPAVPQPRLTVRVTSFPESNGKRNWTALLMRTEPWDGLIGNCGGITIGRGERWNRVAYEAERAKLLIGERDTEPNILDYGDDISTPDEWAGEVREPLVRKRAAPLPTPTQEKP